MTSMARRYECDTCGKAEIEGRGQAHVIFIDRNGRPRTYELCHACTEKVHRMLEGLE